MPSRIALFAVTFMTTSAQLVYFSLGWFWTGEFAFECDSSLNGLKKAADTHCPSGPTIGSYSISDKACTPSSTVVGYMGGSGSSPTYYNYTTANNYSETVRLEYDENRTSFQELLDVYWTNLPDPTFPCQDPAYCPRIFYVNDQQKKLVLQSLDAHQKNTTSKILLAVLPASDYTFWKAEEPHQQYFLKSGEQCGSRQPSRSSATQDKGRPAMDSRSTKVVLGS